MINTQFFHKCTKNNDNSFIITDDIRGEIFCSHCGSVIVEKISSQELLGSAPSFSKNYRYLIKNLEIETIPPDPKALVSRIAAKANSNEKTKRLAWKILDKANELKITASKKPGGLAGAAIYIAGLLNKDKINYMMVERASKTTHATIRKTVRLFRKNIKLSEFKSRSSKVI